MRSPRSIRKNRVSVESLEGRQLLSGVDQFLVQAAGARAALVRNAVDRFAGPHSNATNIPGSRAGLGRGATPVPNATRIGPGAGARAPLVRTPPVRVARPHPTPVRPGAGAGGRAPVVRTPPVRVARPHPAPTNIPGGRVGRGPIAKPAPIATDPSAVSAIMGALGGGVGSEWATLILQQVRDPQSVVRQFAGGQTSTFSATGITFRNPAEQPLFTGRPYDQLLPLAAGGAVFRNNVTEFATILRGEFRNPDTSYYVFAVDRGAGASLGATFAARPGITPDALVTITVGPSGSWATGEIRDLTDGSIQALDSSKIAIQGATLRVFLDASQLPSRGAQLGQYRFALWTQTQPGSDIANVASFAPDASMIPIAVLGSVDVRR